MYRLAWFISTQQPLKDTLTVETKWVLNVLSYVLALLVFNGQRPHAFISVGWTLTGIMVYVCTCYASKVAMAHGQYHTTLFTFRNFYHIISLVTLKKYNVASAVVGSGFQTYK